MVCHEFPSVHCDPHSQKLSCSQWRRSRCFSGTPLSLQHSTLLNVVNLIFWSLSYLAIFGRFIYVLICLFTHVLLHARTFRGWSRVWWNDPMVAWPVLTTPSSHVWFSEKCPGSGAGFKLECPHSRLPEAFWQPWQQSSWYLLKNNRCLCDSSGFLLYQYSWASTTKYHRLGW